MTAFLRFLSALLLTSISSLSILQAPLLPLWYLAILATEYGSWLFLVIVILFGWELGSRSSSFTSCTLALCLLGACLALFPALQASQMGKTLPLQLREFLGPAVVSEPPFSWKRLWLSSNPPARQEHPIFYPTSHGMTLAMGFYSSAVPGIRPCVIVVHGGGWSTGDYHSLSALYQSLAAHGYHVAAINYRLAPEFSWPAQKEDVLAAIAYLRQNSSRLQIDPDRLVLLGRSAGGQIALATCYSMRDPGIRGCIALYSPTDMAFAYRYGKEDDILKSRHLVRNYMGGTPEAHPQIYTEASPLALITDQTPPTLLIQGTRDELVWFLHGRRLQRALLASQRPCFLLEMPWATHAFDVTMNGPAGQLSLFSILWFLEVYTR